MLPFTVNVNPSEPAFALGGESEVNIAGGVEGVIVNVRVFDTTPLVITETFAVPAVARSTAEIVALRLVELTRLVVLLAPLQRTTDPLTKPLPVTLNVKPALP